MIYTVTFNPCLDLFITLPAPLVPGAIQRGSSQLLRPGGKGVNTSIVLHRLGADTKALGFFAGMTGDFFLDLLKAHCPADFVQLTEGSTRINVKLEADTETAVNGSGITPDEAALRKLEEKLHTLEAGDTLLLSGKAETNDLLRLGTLCKQSGAKLMVDTSDEALRASLPLRPWLIKPNAEELGALLETAPATPETAFSMMQQAQKRGAQNVLLSLGGDGAMLLSSDGRVYHAQAVGKYEIMSTVGAGDSLSAGFLAALTDDKNEAEALALAVAAGTAAACNAWLPEKAEIEAILPFVKIRQIP